MARLTYWILSLLVGLSTVTATAAACVGDPFDSAAEVAMLKKTYPQSKLTGDRKTTLDDLMGKIETLKGRIRAATYSNLRGKALSMLDLERIPRWPQEKVDALKTANDDTVSETIKTAQGEWAAKRYTAGHALLDAAMKRLKVSAKIYRC